MGRRQREKGARGELEAAQKLREVLRIDAARSARNGVDGAADLVTSMPHWRYEVKRYARLGIERIMQAAELDAAMQTGGPTSSVLLMRADDCEWLFTIRLTDLPQWVRDYQAQELRDP